MKRAGWAFSLLTRLSSGAGSVPRPALLDPQASSGNKGVVLWSNAAVMSTLRCFVSAFQRSRTMYNEPHHETIRMRPSSTVETPPLAATIFDSPATWMDACWKSRLVNWFRKFSCTAITQIMQELCHSGEAYIVANYCRHRLEHCIGGCAAYIGVSEPSLDAVNGL